MRTNNRLCVLVTGVSVIIQPFIGPGDGLLTYLPLAHILELVFENAALYWGATLGYGNPKTLSDASVRNCAGDIREFKPSVLVGVPAVFESVKKGITAKVNAGSPVVQNMFWGALGLKSRLLHTGLPGSGLLDSVVFKKIKEATGGRLKLCMNGGGPISKETQQFISMAIAPMIIGYGLTETTAMGALMSPLEWSAEAMGPPPGSIEIKLVDFPDAGYFVTNKPNPQGEVWIRGASVTEGYYDNEKETAEAMGPDGWFKTGDIGEWLPNGHLNLIDRKKNLVKTLNGEYIALEKLESIYRSAPFVGNICVYADQSQAKPVAIIVPLEPALKALAQSSGLLSAADAPAAAAEPLLADADAPALVADVDEDVAAAVEGAEGDGGATVGAGGLDTDFEDLLDEEDGLLEGLAGDAGVGSVGDDADGAVLAHEGGGKVHGADAVAEGGLGDVEERRDGGLGPRGHLGR